jgi:cytoskeletal protein RodZ
MTRGAFPGRLLRERRELRGVSLKEAHKHTRVPIEYLKALEDGNLGGLPVPAFAQGFIQTYCEFLDLEPEYFVDRYRAAKQSAQPARQLQTVTHHNGESFQPQPRWLLEAKAWGSVCAVLIVLWVAYGVVVKPFFVDTTPRVQAGTIEITPPTHFEDTP